MQLGGGQVEAVHRNENSIWGKGICQLARDRRLPGARTSGDAE
jgi:hypothetical protein